MKNQACLLVLLSILMVTTSCKTDTDPLGCPDSLIHDCIDVASKPYYPVSPDAYWMYRKANMAPDWDFDTVSIRYPNTLVTIEEQIDGADSCISDIYCYSTFDLEYDEEWHITYTWPYPDDRYSPKYGYDFYVGLEGEWNKIAFLQESGTPGEHFSEYSYEVPGEAGGGVPGVVSISYIYEGSIASLDVAGTTYTDIIKIRTVLFNSEPMSKDWHMRYYARDVGMVLHEFSFDEGTSWETAFELLEFDIP